MSFLQKKILIIYIYKMADNINKYFSKFDNSNAENNRSTASMNLNTLKSGGYTYLMSFILIIIFFALFSATNITIMKMTGKWSQTDNESSPFYKLIELIMVAFGLAATSIVIINYILGIDIKAKLRDINSGEPKVDISVKTDQVNKIPTDDLYLSQKEVFNIPENNYTYSDAKYVCKAFDAELASIKNLQKAHKKGAEWCSYGWSKNQMALFPTQYDTWEKLQKTKDHKNDCGRPGVNGGYIPDPNLKFGVNCYGYKPDINKINKDYMDNLTLYPRTNKEKEIEDKVNKWKNNTKNMLISPFNSTSWSKS